MAKSRFERQWNGALEVPIFLINVLEERNLSNQVAHHFQVPHQSPQLLVIQGNKCIYYASHNAINAEDVEALLNIKK
jgi:bacillithiol system protein YtxJ